MKLLSGGLLCFGAIAWCCSACVQGVKHQSSLCPGVQSSSVSFVGGGGGGGGGGGAYNDSIPLSRVYM